MGLSSSRLEKAISTEFPESARFQGLENVTHCSIVLSKASVPQLFLCLFALRDCFALALLARADAALLHVAAFFRLIYRLVWQHVLRQLRASSIVLLQPSAHATSKFLSQG